jgi:hypothetical protein
MNNNCECSLCNWMDYDSDWGGRRWMRETTTICPECGKRYSGKLSKTPIPEKWLVDRLNRRNEGLWDKLKRFFRMDKKIKIIS